MATRREQQEKKWLVVVRPARQKPPNTVQGYAQQSSWSTFPPVTIQTITAKSAKEAAEKANVPAGATAYVAQLGYVEKFERPEKAPLVKKAA